MISKKFAAAFLSLALMAPAGAAFAAPAPYSHHVVHNQRVRYVRHRYVRRYHYRGHYYTHYYSRTRGTAIGAVAGAILTHHHPLKGAIIGGAIGNAVQYIRSKHHRRH